MTCDQCGAETRNGCCPFCREIEYDNSEEIEHCIPQLSRGAFELAGKSYDE